MMYSNYSLNDLEKQALLQVAESSLAVSTMAEFKLWISGPVRAYFPHERMVCAVGQMFGDEIRIRHLAGVNCPQSCLERFARITSCRERHLVRRWLSQHRAQVVGAADMATQLSPKEREDAIETGMSNLAVFGSLDSAGQGGTCFSFGQIPGTLNARHAYKLELVMPYLHQALMRVCHMDVEKVGGSPGRPAALTRREQEILSLMSTGLSNRAIAQKLSRSELTVQNHVHAIFKKLGVSNRVAAVTMRRVIDSAVERPNPGPTAGIRMKSSAPAAHDTAPKAACQDSINPECL